MRYLTSDEIQELQIKANEIRQSIIEMLAEAGSGHTAGPLGMAEAQRQPRKRNQFRDASNVQYPPDDRADLPRRPVQHGRRRLAEGCPRDHRSESQGDDLREV